MTNTIEYFVKNVYGQEQEYVADKELASNIQGLTGKKTINAKDRRMLEALGCNFEEVIAPRK